MAAKTTENTFPCPVCKKQVPFGAAQCPWPDCQVDLSGLAAIDTIGQDLYTLALRRIKENKPEEALQILNTASIYASENVDVWVVRGKLLAQDKKYDEAVRSWEHALLIQPEEPRAKAGIQEIQRIIRRRRLGRYLLVALLACVLFSLGLGSGWWVHRYFPAATLPTTISPTEQVLPTPETSPSPAVTLVSPSPTSSPEPLATEEVCGVQTGYEDGTLNVRSGPGMNYPPISWLYEGGTVTVLDSTGSKGWIKVQLGATGIEGWVYGVYCR